MTPTERKVVPTDDRWRVRKMANLLAPNWQVHDPDGNFVGKFYTHKEAMKKFNDCAGIGDAVGRWLSEL